MDSSAHTAAVPTFAAEIVAPAAKQFSLANWLPAAKQCHCQIGQLAANQFSLPKWAACSEPVLAADFYNKPPRQK